MKLGKIMNMDEVIAKSMKKVFKEEIDEIEQELKKLYDKYNIKSSNELESNSEEFQGEDVRRDLERIRELEDELERLNSYLREVNMKIL